MQPIKSTTLLVLFFTFLFYSANGQSLRQYEKAAENAFITKDYYAALEYFKVILDATEGRVDINYKYAESARNFKALPLAEEYYQKVMDSETANNYPEVNYWLASVKQQLGKYEEAKNGFQKFINSNPSNHLTILARKSIQDIDWAIELMKQPQREIAIKVLDNSVNTDYSEFAPVLRGDSLYYSSLRFTNNEDIYARQRQISKLMLKVENNNARTMRGNFNSDELLTAHASFSANGNSVYYTICSYSKTGDIPCNIYVKNKKKDGRWGKAIKLSEDINQSGTTSTQPSIGKDKNGNEVLYFVSDREGGKGGLDIWYSKKIGKNEFSMPINFAKVNTVLDDVTPFWQEAHQTLYFSSNGQKTMGGFDLYKIKLNSTSKNDVQHLGQALNTSYDDLYFSVNAAGTKAYFASNRPGSKYIDKDKVACCNDIFEADISPLKLAVKLLVFDVENETELPGVTVEFIEQPKEILLSKINKDANDFIFSLEKDKKYILKAKHPNYHSDTIVVNTIDWIKSDTLTRKLFLKPMPKGSDAPLFLQALTFDAATKFALSGATVRLVNLKDNKENKRTNEHGNNFDFGVKRNQVYTIEVSRNGYYPDTLEFAPNNINSSYTFVKRFYLNPKPIGPVSKLTLAEYLPLPVFFDNDEPDNGTTRGETQKNYDETYYKYFSRKNEFTRVYTSDLKDIERIEAETRMENFFENDVKRNFENLEGFTIRLLLYMQQGDSAEIRIKGYASPRAEDDYNVQLTRRRISSLKNHFHEYDNGIFMSYINSGQLIISQQPFGESKAPGFISDDLGDLKASIYSIEASKERRVEIIEIK